MKKILTICTLLLSLLSLNAEGETKTVTFNFKDGTSLNPKQIMPEQSSCISVLNTTFTNDIVSLSFSKDLSLIPILYETTESTELRLYRGNHMYVNVGEDAEITQIKFKSLGMTNFGVSGNVGTYNYENDTWTNVDAQGRAIGGIHILDCTAGSNDPCRILIMEVTYNTSVSHISIVDCSLPDESEVTSFQSMQLTMNNAIAKRDANKKVTVTSELGETQNMDVSYNNNVATLSLATPITYRGFDVDYTIHVPAGTFYDAEGNYNAEYDVDFTVVSATKSLTLESVSPEEGNVLQLPTQITLHMSAAVGHVDNTVECLVDGGPAYGTLGFIGGGSKDVTLTIANSYTTTAEGTHYIVIPEGSIHDAGYNALNPSQSASNPEITLVYTIGEYPSDETYAEAVALLDCSGVGYPKENSAERIALKNLVVSKRGSDAVFNAAMDEYKNTSNVTLPKKGHVYTIMNVTKDGTKTYLKYSNNKVTTTSDPAEAYKFEADSLADGTITFKTGDNMYLHTLSTYPAGHYVGTSSDNVCAYNADVNKLVLSHFDYTTVPPATSYDTFGKVTIFGALESGKTSPASAYSLITNGNVDLLLAPDLKYEDASSSAFVISESDQEAPDVYVTLAPSNKSTVTSLSQITASFSGNGLSNIYLNPSYNTMITLKDVNSLEESTVTVTKYSDLIYTIKFASLPAGTYALSVAKGAFYQVYKGKTYYVDSFTDTVVVSKGYDFNYEYDKVATMYCTQEFPSTGASITQFNNMSYYFKNASRNWVEPFVDTTMVVSILDPSDHVAATGKFVKDTVEVTVKYDGFFRNGTYLGEVSYYNQNNHSVQLTNGKIYNVNDYTDVIKEVEDIIQTYYLRLILNRTLTVADSKEGIYLVYIPKATFGDRYFGEYLKNPLSVARQECTVNSAWELPYHVKETPTGISEIKSQSDSNVIYDLSGRRVNTISKSGIYILNGKKVLVNKD